MENREYYTPEISELFVGYECEALTDDFVFGFDWRPYRVSDLNEKLSQQFIRLLRTPYLCKQDIIDLKWEYNCQFEDKFSYYKVGGKGMYKNELHVNFNNQEIHIWNGANTLGFKGVCKSKNELKKLMKDYLNIPI